ncbi:tyrosine-type recombinase/integrase, partial [Klebsiella pneumoniae]|uniref:tyrosine-type recombinase/integrase n=1 Tax=Klebsiella pneumoniae TaxID=573 RepID=UPI00350EA958
NRLIRCVCGKKIGPDPRNFNQRVSLGRNDLLIRTFPNAALKRIGYGGKLVAHGLRSIASTAMNEAGLNPDVIEAALAHSDRNEVRKAYNRTTYLSQRKDLMNWWGNFIYLNSSLYLKKESA